MLLGSSAALGGSGFANRFTEAPPLDPEVLGGGASFLSPPKPPFGFDVEMRFSYLLLPTPLIEMVSFSPSLSEKSLVAFILFFSPSSPLSYL